MRTKRYLSISLLVAVATTVRAVVLFTGGDPGDQLFSNTGNWQGGVHPSGDNYFFGAAATTAGNRAQIDRAFTVVPTEAVIGQINGTAYVEVLSGAALASASKVTVGWVTGQTARHGDLILRSGSTLRTGSTSGDWFIIGGSSSGIVTIEAGAAVNVKQLKVAANGTLVYEFDSNSVTTIYSDRTVGTEDLNGVIRLDLGNLTTVGSYTLIDSSGEGLAGALVTWLNAAGGTRNGTGNISEPHFAVVNADGITWSLTTADSGKDLIFNVTAVPQPPVVG